MKSKQICNKISYQIGNFAKQAGGVTLVTLIAGSIVLTSCGRKSQEEEDVATLKLVGYDLDQIGLFKAVENDDLSALKIFKERKFDMTQADLKGRTAMHVAAGSGSVSAMNFLVKNGVEVDTADTNGITPLMVAARAGRETNGNVEVIKYLLAKGADAQAKDETGKFALIHALDGGSPEAIELLAGQSRELLDIGLLYAAAQNDYASIPVLVRYGASVYARNKDKTALMIAAERGYPEVVQVLLNEGANMYAVSDDGKLARDFAEGNETVLAVLLESENAVGDDALALEWSEEELEALVQKAMDRAPALTELETTSGEKVVGEGVTVAANASTGAAQSTAETMSKNGSESAIIADTPAASKTETNTGEYSGTVRPFMGSGTGQQSGNIISSAVTDSSNSEVVLERISGKNLSVEVTDTAPVEDQVVMAAYAEKSLPVQVKAIDEGRVEIYDLRAGEQGVNTDPVVTAGSEIGVTGLKVKQIKKKMVNNKLTGGQPKELVTLVIEDMESGQNRELYAGYESQAAESVAVVQMKNSGEYLIVEREDEFYDANGVSFKVIDVSDKEVIIENIGTGQVSLLPLMGVKR